MDRLLRKRKSWVSSERSWSAWVVSWEVEGRFMASSSMSAIVEVYVCSTSLCACSRVD